MSEEVLKQKKYDHVIRTKCVAVGGWWVGRVATSVDSVLFRRYVINGVVWWFRLVWNVIGYNLSGIEIDTTHLKF